MKKNVECLLVFKKYIYIYKKSCFGWCLFGFINPVFLTANQQSFSGWEIKCPFSTSVSLALCLDMGSICPSGDQSKGMSRQSLRRRDFSDITAVVAQHLMSEEILPVEIYVLKTLSAGFVAWTLQHFKFYLRCLSAFGNPNLKLASVCLWIRGYICPSDQFYCKGTLGPGDFFQVNLNFGK